MKNDDHAILNLNVAPYSYCQTTQKTPYPILQDNHCQNQNSSMAENENSAATEATATTSKDGSWVGIDFGTTNSCVAVYDRVRGHPKWIRLSIAPPSNQKMGRIVPTLLIVATKQYVDMHYADDNSKNHWVLMEDHPELRVCLGGYAQQLVETETDLEASCIRSLKRRLLEESVENDKNHDTITVLPAGSHRDGPQTISKQSLVTTFLRELRLSATDYLTRHVPKKHLDIPYTITYAANHCCLGVPAAASLTYKQFLVQCAHRAGWETAWVHTESTAAAMAYGVTFQEVSKTILVFDMGGGTTDLTVARKKSADGDFAVLEMAGNNRLGGDDMDAAILNFLLQTGSLQNEERLEVSNDDKPRLLQECCRAKLELCRADHPPKRVDIRWQGRTISFSQNDLEQVLQPTLEQLRLLVESVIPHQTVHEVILIGGASRVPAVRRLLRDLFPTTELCTSIQPDSAVAQGCAVAAALQSKLIPLHELRSAMMLDTIPYPIGVLTDNQKFVEILEKGATLPAADYATFTLADVRQRGVTIQAVECVDAQPTYVRLGEFTFLLHKLTEAQFGSLPFRTIDVGMDLQESGALVVSIFDANDPEHVRKKLQHENNVVGYKADAAFTGEQIFLVVACVVLFFLYVVAKLFFPETDEYFAET